MKVGNQRFKGHRKRKEREEPKGFNYDITFIIPLLSAISYIILYFLKVGYFTYYIIPFNFIAIDIVDSAGVLFLFFLFGLILAAFLQMNKFSIYQDKSHRNYNYITSILNNFTTKWMFVLFLFILAIGSLLCLFLLTLILYTFIPSLFHSMIIAFAISCIIFCLIIWQFVEKKFNIITTCYIFFTVIICSFSIFVAGFTYPLFKESYVIVSGGNLNEEKEYVLIGHYKDSLIVSEVDLDESRVTRNFKIIKVESDHEYNLDFYGELVGRLHRGPSWK